MNGNQEEECGRGHSCCSGCARKEGAGFTGTVVRLGLALGIMLALVCLAPGEAARIAGFGAAYLLAGGGVLYSAVRNLFKGKVFDENFLMSSASLGAFAIGEMPEAAAVMVFYGIGELLQDSAVAKSRKNIVQLMNLRPDFARVRRGENVETVAPETVAVGEVIRVRPGEKIPLDGIVESGESFLDTRALTGESVPRRAVPGDALLSGTVNMNGSLEIRVTKPFAESTVSRILDLVRNAGAKKSESEKFITKFARYYTPSVVGLALLVAVIPPLFGADTFSASLYRALCFLIISCPCALVLSIPLSFFGGIGGAARNGVLVKGGNYLELLNRVGTVVFDKTGTLTKGVFKVTGIHPEAGISEEELLRCAAFAEASSNHPIAKSILEACGKPVGELPEIREMPGLGVAAKSRSGLLVHAGNARLMREIGIGEVPEYAKTAVHVARDGQYLGCVLISDELKPGVRETISELRSLGVSRLAMLTGDNEAIARETAEELGLDVWKAELLPQDKVSELEALMAAETPGRITAFVGDGINDAPVLTRADLGIAMGGLGSDAAIEAADVVIVTGDLAPIASAVRIAAKTRRIVFENIMLSLGFKGIVMLLALFGYASVWFAIFADVGVALLALANAGRALTVGNPVRTGRKKVMKTSCCSCYGHG
ncbi:MAG: Cadmium, zinc and cobalt-transporting ATPase [Lentisphaerae bacterium ADurb.Bin242]|nr:MAG: Cadmium, zinc and cobalt-transporting ATPase [Lentisphaerae bacterium ADurb.Bin242]